jgi:hypothetical protein
MLTPVLFACLSAQAGPPSITTAPAHGHPVAVDAVAGLGTPLGWLGIEGQVDVLRWLVLSGGVGRGLSSGSTQLAGMARGRWVLHASPLGEAAVTGGYGLSHGKFHWEPVCVGYFVGDPACSVVKNGTLWWHNLELAIEARHGRGPLQLFVRLFGGVGVPANPGALSCDGCTTDAAKKAGTRPLPFLGGAVGVLLR